MGVYIQTNRNKWGGTDGTIDPLRILSVSSPQPNDFDPSVLFSSLWPTQQVEKAEFSIGLPAPGTNIETQGSWNPSRKFVDIPLVLGIYRNNSGGYSYPHGYTQNKKGNQPSSTIGLEALDQFTLSVQPLGSNQYGVVWTIKQLNSWDLGGAGILRLFVFGASP